MPKNTAILVIHGIGNEVPFETLDSFAVGLIQCLQTHKRKFKITHDIKGRNGATGTTWVENYVSLQFSKEKIDIHEYYWAPMAEAKMKVDDVIKWVDTTLESSQQIFGKEANEKIREKYSGSDQSYWKQLEKFSTVLGDVFFSGRLALIIVSFLVDWFPNLKWLISLEGWLKQRLTNVLVDFIADVAIYANSDESSEYYHIRQQILAESQALLDQILDLDYENVIVAGHSLGSVIAYDTLNLLNLKANLNSKLALRFQKIKGLVTFGSPLDLITLFFRVTGTEKQFLRRQILDHLHSFKAKKLDFFPIPDNFQMKDGIRSKLKNLNWINFYSERDPISKALDFYEISKNGNIKLEIYETHKKGNSEEKLLMPWGLAHTGYWTQPEFYDGIIKRMKL